MPLPNKWGEFPHFHNEYNRYLRRALEMMDIEVLAPGGFQQLVLATSGHEPKHFPRRTDILKKWLIGQIADLRPRITLTEEPSVKCRKVDLIPRNLHVNISGDSDTRNSF